MLQLRSMYSQKNEWNVLMMFGAPDMHVDNTISFQQKSLDVFSSDSSSTVWKYRHICCREALIQLRKNYTYQLSSHKWEPVLR